MGFYQINTPKREAAFLAQVAHESGRFQFVREIWGPTAAQKKYEGRADLGNVQPGDGERFRGHGLIQVTGRRNHALARENLRLCGWRDVPDFEAVPQALEIPVWAAASAAEFWDRHRLNALADAGEFDSITRRINGGQNGQAERRLLYAQLKKALV